MTNISNKIFDIAFYVLFAMSTAIVLIGMWVYRESLDFNILLPGVARRTYFFPSILPIPSAYGTWSKLNE